MSRGPIFTNAPKTPEERWELLLRMMERHYDLKFPAAPPSGAVAEKEKELGFSIPFALRSWIELAETLGRERLEEIFRNGLDVAPVPGHDALSLIMQVEGDVLWAVDLANLGIDDPPIEIYWIDLEDESEFLHQGQAYQHATSLLLAHLIHYLRGKEGGLQVSLDSDERKRVCSQLGKVLPCHCDYGGLDIFEGDGLLCALLPDETYRESRQFFVILDQKIPLNDLPQVVVDQLGRGGCFSGLFAEKL